MKRKCAPFCVIYPRSCNVVDFGLSTEMMYTIQTRCPVYVQTIVFKRK